MDTNEKKTVCLTSEEAEYINELLERNEYIIRAQIRTVLKEKFNQIGEDCISELYLLACEKVSVLKTHKNPDAWLVIASKNVANNMARKHTALLQNITDEEITNVKIETDVFEDALYNIWIQEGSIERLLSLLTPREREIYDLLYKERQTAKQVSEKLGVSDSTVRNIALAIKKKIKNAIETKLF